MKKMNQWNSLLLITSILLITSCVTTNLPETYQVEPEVLEAKGGKVQFTINGTIPEKSFHKKAIVEFMPYLKHDGKTTELKTLTLRGENTEGEGIVINSKTGGSFTYTDEFDYSDDMRASELCVKAKITKGKKELITDEYKIADGVIATYSNIVHDEELIYANSGYEKVTIHSENATIFFRVNKANLNMNLSLNKSDAATTAMSNLDDFIMKGWEVKDINIDAWASPEGEIHFNDNLAEKRSMASNKFIENKIKKINKKRAKELDVDVSELEQEIVYNSKGHGEDWDGFMNAIKESDIKDKNQIITIVGAQTDANKREQEIRNMTVIYKEIEDDILPPLRRADITINCFEPKRTDAEIAQLATSNPDSLSYKEILHAATLTEDNQAKYNIYKSAFNNKDKDWKAYNNAAAAAIELDMINEAGSILNQAANLSKNNGKIENNKGVIACRQNDYTSAEKHFMNAEKFGENENYNLGIVMVQKGEYQRAINYFNNIDCRHNVALAQLLSGNMNDALTNLKCSPESVETHYMLAVYGARSNKPEMVYEYLEKAVKLDASIKDEAKIDREFLEYFDEDAFKKIIE